MYPSFFRAVADQWSALIVKHDDTLEKQFQLLFICFINYFWRLMQDMCGKERKKVVSSLQILGYLYKLVLRKVNESGALAKQK